MFKKGSKVLVANPINFQGPSPWKDREGKVVKCEPGWVTVAVEMGDKVEEIPFRTRELVEVM